MRKQKYILWISLIFNAAFVLTLIVNQIHKDDRPGSRSRRRRQSSETWEKMPDDVKEQLRNIWRDFPKRIQPIQTLLDSQRVQLSKILLQDEPDSMLINVKLDSIGALQTDLEKTIVRQMLHEKNLLPEEYQDGFAKMMMWRFIRQPPARRRDHENSPDSTRAGRRGSREAAERR